MKEPMEPQTKFEALFESRDLPVTPKYKMTLFAKRGLDQGCFILSGDI